MYFIIQFLAQALLSVILVFIITILLIIWKYPIHWKYRIYKLGQDIPGPPSIPFIGNFIPFLGPLDHIWRIFRKLSLHYNGIFKVWTLNRFSVFISEPDYVEVLLSSAKNLRKSEAYDFLELWLGSGLLISDGDKWKSRRKLLTPAFHFNILKQFVTVFEEQSERTVQIIRKECDKPFTNVIPISTEHALGALCETTMGIKMNFDDNNSEFIKYKNAIYHFGEIFMERITKPIFYSQFLFELSSMGKITTKIITTLRNFTLNVIDERLNNWETRNQQMIKSASGKKLLPMMDILITEMKNGANIDYNGIVEEVDTFMFEGHDTTSMGISFMLMLLASEPEVQDKILEEQNSIFHGSTRMATYEELQNMEYLERVIKESLRLCPPVPVIGRRLEEDLQMGQYIIPKESYLYVSIYDLHHNPKYWDQPEKFDPDRFLPDNAAQRHPFAYVPFSAGSRNCIGQRFVMLEMKSFVSKVIREYILEPVDTLETIPLKVDLVMRPVNGVKVKFRRRK
uniref:cytochrome P450 4C1-like n=1 Tax=Chrysoperla carnea TaxID=189513 RepID=UPI003B75C7C5